MLKHRKRREKTVRKLDAMQANLNRLTDLTGEIRRQLGPLGRQAASPAGRPACRPTCGTRRCVCWPTTWRRSPPRSRRRRSTSRPRSTTASRCRTRWPRRPPSSRTAEATLREATPALQQAQDTWFALSALAERMRGTIALAGERARNLAAPARDAAHRPGPRRAGGRRRPGRGRAGGTAGDGRGRRGRAGRCHRRTHRLRASPARRRGRAGRREPADRRSAGGPGPTRRPGRTRPGRGCPPATTRSPDWPARSPRPATGRRPPTAAFAAAQDSVGDLDSSEVGLDEAHEEAAAAAAAAKARTAELTDALRTAQTEASTLRARVEALVPRPGPAGRHPGAAGRPARQLPGLLGGVADALDITPGYETAIAAALGAIAEAVAVSSVPDAVQALELLRANGSGRAGVLVQGPRQLPGPTRLAGAAGRRALGDRPARRPRRAAARPWPEPSTGSRRPRHGRCGRALSSTFRTSGRSPRTAT